jgi:hypothetical protein
LKTQSDRAIGKVEILFAIQPGGATAVRLFGVIGVGNKREDFGVGVRLSFKRSAGDQGIIGRGGAIGVVIHTPRVIEDDHDIRGN